MKQKYIDYSNVQLFWLVSLRVLIGWHFLYEGLAKLMNPNWSSVGYLLDSEGFFKEFYISLASNPTTLGVVDFLNVWGLILIGLGLILGLFTRISTFAGVLLLALYYFSHPPCVGFKYALPMEGSYLIVNKILIEMIALVVLFVFPTGKRIGIDRLICRKNRKE
jgi:thiosulfate dehydrogenase [quinone] large subunit